MTNSSPTSAATTVSTATVFPSRAQGLGGGGALFRPAVSPHDPSVSFVACDMGGLYLTTDDGATWLMLDGRLVRGSNRFAAVFDPAAPDHVLAAHPQLGLQESVDNGTSWTAVSPPMPPGVVVTAAAFTQSRQTTLLIGTNDGIWELVAGTWQQTLTGQPQLVSLGDGTTLSVNPADVVELVVLTDPADGTETWFTATTSDVLRRDDGGWMSIAQGLPARPLGPVIAATDGNFPPAWYNAGRIRGLAGATDVTRLVLWATVLTVVEADGSVSGGVYRYEHTAAVPGTWTREMQNGINTTPGDQGGGTDVPRYEHLALAAQTPDTVLVSCLNTTFSPNVYRGVHAGSQTTWTGVYTGYQNDPTNNLDPGWLDQSDKGPLFLGPGWGQGGAANGLTADPNDSDHVLFTSNGVVHRTTDGGSHWQQRYTELTAGTSRQADARWDSTGLDATTVWHYVVHADPQKQSVHFVCSTDIGLARSDTGGDRWDYTGYSDIVGNKATKRTNVYDLAIEYPDGPTIWAAVSDQHDIPHETQHAVAPKSGAVLFSTDDGATWTTLPNPGLSAGPVVSLIRIAGVLHASVWGSGVYHLTPDPASGPDTWKSVAPFPPGTSPHCYRLDADAAGVLHCVVAPLRNGSTLTRGGLYRLDGGAWTDLTAGLVATLAPSVVAPVDFCFSPSDSDVVYLCTASVQASNGGGGVHRFDGTTWEALPIPFATSGQAPFPQPFAPWFDPRDDGTLYVASTSHGLWVTADAASPPAQQTWTEVVALPFLGAQRISCDPSDHNSAFVSTFGGGVWKIALPLLAPPSPTAVIEK